jgi:hypothetical protein
MSETEVTITNGENVLPIQCALCIKEGAEEPPNLPVVANLCPELQLSYGDSDDKRPFNLSKLATEPFRTLTENERKALDDPNDPLEAAMKAKKKRPLDAYERKIDFRRDVKLLIVKPPRTKLSTKDMANDYAAHVLNAVANHSNQWYEYVTRFVHEMYGPGQRAFWKRMEDGFTKLLKEEQAAQNRLAWNAFYGVAGTVQEGDQEQSRQDASSNRDRTLHVSYDTQKTMSLFNPVGVPFMESMSCHVFDMTQCIHQKIEVCRMLQGYCKGYGTSEVEQEVLRYALEQMGRNMADDMCLVDRETGQPDHNRVCFEVPHYPTPQAAHTEPTEHLTYASAEMDAGIAANPGACDDLTSHKIGTYAVSAGYWSGKLMHTMEATAHTDLDSSYTMSWGMGHCANVTFKKSCMTSNGQKVSYYKSPAHRTRNGKILVGPTQRPNVAYVKPTKTAPRKPVKALPANAMDSIDGKTSYRGADEPRFGLVYTQPTKPQMSDQQVTETLIANKATPVARPGGVDGLMVPRRNVTAFYPEDLGVESRKGNFSKSALLWNFKLASTFKLPGRDAAPGPEGRTDASLFRNRAKLVRENRKKVRSRDSPEELAMRWQALNELFTAYYYIFAGAGPDVTSKVFNPVAMFVHSDPYMVAYSQMISMNPELYASTDTSDMAHEFLSAFRSLYPSAIVKLSEENVGELCRQLAALSAIVGRQSLDDDVESLINACEDKTLYYSDCVDQDKLYRMLSVTKQTVSADSLIPQVTNPEVIDFDTVSGMFYKPLDRDELARKGQEHVAVLLEEVLGAISADDERHKTMLKKSRTLRQLAHVEEEVLRFINQHVNDVPRYKIQIQRSFERARLKLNAVQEDDSDRIKEILRALRLDVNRLAGTDDLWKAATRRRTIDDIFKGSEPVFGANSANSQSPQKGGLFSKLGTPPGKSDDASKSNDKDAQPEKVDVEPSKNMLNKPVNEWSGREKLGAGVAAGTALVGATGLGVALDKALTPKELTPEALTRVGKQVNAAMNDRLEKEARKRRQKEAIEDEMEGGEEEEDNKDEQVQRGVRFGLVADPAADAVTSRFQTAQKVYTQLLMSTEDLEMVRTIDEMISELPEREKNSAKAIVAQAFKDNQAVDPDLQKKLRLFPVAANRYNVVPKDFSMKFDSDTFQWSFVRGSVIVVVKNKTPFAQYAFPAAATETNNSYVALVLACLADRVVFSTPYPNTNIIDTAMIFSGKTAAQVGEFLRKNVSLQTMFQTTLSLPDDATAKEIFEKIEQGVYSFPDAPEPLTVAGVGTREFYDTPTGQARGVYKNNGNAKYGDLGDNRTKNQAPSYLRGSDQFRAALGMGDVDENVVQNYLFIMRLHMYFGILFSNDDGAAGSAGSAGNSAFYDPFSYLGPQLTAFRCYIPSYKKVQGHESQPAISHIRNDLNEVGRFLRYFEKEYQATFQRTLRQDLPALKASVDSVDRQDNQQLRAATDLMRRLASAFCKDPVHVYARTRMPPTTYSAAFFQSALDTRATRDQARALLSSSETIPGMAYWPRSQGPSSIFHLWNFFTAMVASKDDVAYALGKFDPSVFYVKQFRRPENVNVRELYFSAKPSVPSKCAPRNEGLLNKAFDMCGTCGIFPYRLLTMPMASLYHVLDENQMDYAQAIKLEDMSSVHYSALRNNSAVINVIPGVKDPDLKKLHKMSGTSPQEQLVLIRQALIACFGTDVAAMLCEATLLRDPVMMKLSVATGEDIPFAAGRTMLFQPGYLGIVAEGTALGDTQYKVKVENDRVYLVDGTRTLTEAEAQGVVLSAIVREIRDNVLAFTEPMESSADKRMRVAEKYLMLNGKAMLDNMRHFKSTLDGWSKLHEAHDPRGVSLDSPELLLLTRVAGGATPQPCRRAFWEFRKWDLATPYAYSFEELLKARSKEENRDLYRILTRLSLLPDITPNHLPPVASDDCENGFEKYHGMPTFGPSLLMQNPEWRSLVEDFSEWCNNMIHLRNCAAAPGVMMSHMGLMNEGLRLRGADAPDPAAEPTFGLTDTDLSAGLCKDFVSQRQDGKLFSRFTPDADRDAECPHLGGDECVKTDLRKDEDEVKRTIDADVLIFSAGERQPDFNQADCHDLTYNTQDRPQFFSVMDACGLLWRERMFHNPAYTRSAIDKDKRVLPESGVGSLENMHYHARILAEAAAVARVEHDERCAHDLSQTYEVNVKRNPEVHFGVSLIGKMLDESFQALYPLQPLKGTLRRKLERVRSLPIMFATMDCYSSKLQGKSFSKVSTTGGGETPIWCPISHHHYYQLLQAADLFDKERKIPITPWTSLNKDAWDFSGLMHSSHSVLKVDRLTAEQYADYCTNHLKYQVPREDPEAPHVPFARYGGTPVAADFIGAPVHKPAPGHEDRSAHLCQARFGHTGPLDLGELPFEDHGILQDAFAYSYRPSLRLSPAQVEAVRNQKTEVVHISNFRAYTRNLTLLALASKRPNDSSEYGEVDRGLLMTHLMRMYSGASKFIDDTGREAPVIVGYAPISASQRSNPNTDRPVMAYACTIGYLRRILEAMHNGSVPRKISNLDGTLRQALVRSVSDVHHLMMKEADATRFHNEMERGYRMLKQHHPSLTKEEYMRDQVERYRNERNVYFTQLLGDHIMKTNHDEGRKTMEQLRSMVIRDVPSDRLDPKGVIDRAISNGIGKRNAHKKFIPFTSLTELVGKDVDEIKRHSGKKPGLQDLVSLFASYEKDRLENAKRLNTDFLHGPQSVAYEQDEEFQGVEDDDVGTPESFASAPRSMPNYGGGRADSTVSSTFGQSSDELKNSLRKLLNTVEQRFEMQKSSFSGTTPFLSKHEILEQMSVPDFLARAARRELR